MLLSRKSIGLGLTCCLVANKLTPGTRRKASTNTSCLVDNCFTAKGINGSLRNKPFNAKLGQLNDSGFGEQSIDCRQRCAAVQTRLRETLEKVRRGYFSPIFKSFNNVSTESYAFKKPGLPSHRNA